MAVAPAGRWLAAGNCGHVNCSGYSGTTGAGVYEHATARSVVLQGMANDAIYALSRKHWLIYHGVQCQHQGYARLTVPGLLRIVTEPIVLYVSVIGAKCDNVYAYTRNQTA